MSSSTLQHCPDCSRVLYFSHADTNIIHCGCGSTVYRSDGAVFAKPFYTVANPFDVIQPGTEGSWNGKSFRVLGRMRAWIEEFVFNYWTVLWNDGSITYLGEGYGLYAVYEPIVIDRDLKDSLDTVNVGTKRDLFSKETFILERKYRCYKWELEGEAWLPNVPSSFRTFEFAAADGRRIEVIEFQKNATLSFSVFYTSKEALQLKHTRNGVPPLKTLTCNHCAKENTLKAFPFSQSYACVHCGIRYGLEDGLNFKQVGQRNSTDIGPDIELGSKGKIRGVEYEVIGYAQKEEANQYRSKWKEYTLFNPQSGFAFLSEFSGHWILLKERGDAPVLMKESSKTINHEKEEFQLFNLYNYLVVNAKGEFPYQAFNDQEKKVREFISPPEVWIQEKSGREGIIWFLGEHITGSELQAAFGNKISLPWKSGVGAVEPKGFVSMEKIIRFGIAATLLLVLAHVITSMTHRNQLISDNTYDFSPNADTAAFVKKGIVLDKWSSNLQFEIYADVDNSWCEVSGTLVDVVKGTEYSFEKGVEYYYGYTDGESWREGDKKEIAYLNSIPAGRYDLIVRATRETKLVFNSYSTGPPTTAPSLQSFHMIVTYDTTNDRNLFLCMIPVVLWAIGHVLLVRYNERRRWYNSPYSPYTYSDEN